jgi:hypothetical protein
MRKVLFERSEAGVCARAGKGVEVTVTAGWEGFERSRLGAAMVFAIGLAGDGESAAGVHGSVAGRVLSLTRENVGV